MLFRANPVYSNMRTKTKRFVWNGLEVEATVTIHKGIRTFSNGDPGYPDDLECSIDNVEEYDRQEFIDWLIDNEYISHTNEYSFSMWEKFEDDIVEYAIEL